MNKTFLNSSPLSVISSFSYEIFTQSCISTTRLPTYQIHWLSTRCSSWQQGIPHMWCMYHTGWMVCTLGLWLDNYCMFHWVYLFLEHTYTLPAYHHHGKCQHCLLKINQLRTLFNTSSVGSVVTSWLVRPTPQRAVWLWALAGDIVLCSWTRHITLTVPLSTQVYQWVPVNLCWGVALRWTSIPSRGE